TGLAWLNTNAPPVFAILIPMLYPFLVPLGLHWPLNALMLANIKSLGYDFIQGPMGAWNFACFGATAGVLVLSIRDRDVTMRQTAVGALAAGLFGGVSEPSLYGIHLRFKRIYPRMLVGCLTGGLIIGVMGGVKTSAFAFTSLLTIPVFSPMGTYAIAVAASFAVSMTLVIISDYRTAEQKAEALAEEKADEPRVVIVEVGPKEENQAKQWLAALGGADNVVAVRQVAETRVRVEVRDDNQVDPAALREAGLPGVVKVAAQVWHLVAGFDSDQYATAMERAAAAQRVPVPTS
ncbi:MAG: PTS transporter subunit EIIB, partial [Actinomycetia bacterium]|nr:PTS transporter subunit EIIB [Actinomycetes bacterium]